jgi:hypothetical protein
MLSGAEPPQVIGPEFLPNCLKIAVIVALGFCQFSALGQGVSETAPATAGSKPATTEPARTKAPKPQMNKDSGKPWSVMMYGGVGSGSNISQFFTFDAEFENSQFVGLVLNDKMFNFWRHFHFELEGQVIRHVGRQNNWEFNALYVLRLRTFPWDKFLDTSFAAGQGLSYATSPPRIEVERHPNDNAQFLHYLMFELAFALPKAPEWELVTRIHHRSGVFGLFGGVHGGSNFAALGLRYNF